MEMLIHFRNWNEWVLVCMFCRKSGCGSLKWLAAVFICKIQFLEKNF